MDHDPSSSVRIAVLIDADNTSPKYAEALLEELAKYGTPTIKRAYGDFSSQRLSGWTRELNARAIRAIHQNAFTVGKNSTDSALIIDAMDLLYAGNVEAFALVSSDSDFTGLALRLRESGKVVYGLGRQRTPQSLQNACDRFIALEVLGEEPSSPEAAEDTTGPAAGSPADGLADEAPQLNLESALTRAVNATADDEGWTSVSAIGNHLSRTQASFDPRNFGHAKLSSLVSAQAYLESRTEGRQILVRLKGQPAKTTKAAPAKQAPAKQAAKSAAPAKQAPKADAPAKQAAAEQPAQADAPAKQADQATVEQPAAKKTTRSRKTASKQSASKQPAPAAASAPDATPAEASAPEAAEPAASRPTVTKTARKRATKSAPAEATTSTATSAEPTPPEPAKAEPVKAGPAKPVVTRTTRSARKTAATKNS